MGIKVWVREDMVVKKKGSFVMFTIIIIINKSFIPSFFIFCVHTSRTFQICHQKKYDSEMSLFLSFNHDPFFFF